MTQYFDARANLRYKGKIFILFMSSELYFSPKVFENAKLHSHIVQKWECGATVFEQYKKRYGTSSYTTQ